MRVYEETDHNEDNDSNYKHGRYGRWDSNPHSIKETDFKSIVSTNSTTPAMVI